MKIRQGKKSFGDAFSVLCIIQTVAVILAAFIMFVVSRVSPSYFTELTRDIEGIFGQNFDLGGYFTPTDEKEYTPVKGMAICSEETEKIYFVTAVPSENNDMEYVTDIAVMPVSGTVTSEFGYRTHPIYGEESFHSGLDIAASEGSPIHAVLDGTVIAAGTAPKAGNYVKIDHGNSRVTLYCHCSKLYVSEGVSVRRGEVIAAVGQTGLATGPHLHIEFYEDSEITDPQSLLEGAENVY